MTRSELRSRSSGHKNANHRHIAEVPFYIHEGKGHEVHDGKRHDWEAGDLMIVPPYCIHQHFCDEGPAILVYCQAGHGPFVVGGPGGEQMEMHESWTMPEDAKAHGLAVVTWSYPRGGTTLSLNSNFGCGSAALRLRGFAALR